MADQEDKPMPDETQEKDRDVETTPIPEPMSIQNRLDRDFTYHPLKPGQEERYNRIRGLAKMFVTQMLSDVPMSRERSLAITKMEEAVFWANAGIARNE